MKMSLINIQKKNQLETNNTNKSIGNKRKRRKKKSVIPISKSIFKSLNQSNCHRKRTKTTQQQQKKTEWDMHRKQEQ